MCAFSGDRVLARETSERSPRCNDHVQCPGARCAADRFSVIMALRNALKRAASAVPWSVAAPRAMSTAVADRVVLGGASGVPLARRLAPFRANVAGLTHGARSFAAAADCAHPDFSPAFPRVSLLPRARRPRGYPRLEAAARARRYFLRDSSCAKEPRFCTFSRRPRPSASAPRLRGSLVANRRR